MEIKRCFAKNYLDLDTSKHISYKQGTITSSTSLNCDNYLRGPHRTASYFHACICEFISRILPAMTAWQIFESGVPIVRLPNFRPTPTDDAAGENVDHAVVRVYACLHGGMLHTNPGTPLPNLGHESRSKNISDAKKSMETYFVYMWLSFWNIAVECTSTNLARLPVEPNVS